MTRWKASGTHLALSSLVLATIAVIVVWRWYPPALFHMARADKLLLTLAGVDIVIGPLLTLIVYKKGKKSLKFDLAVIVLLQLAALVYGLQTLWNSRPVFLVGVVDRFELVFAHEIAPQDLARAPARYRNLSLFGPRLVGAELPHDPVARGNILFSALGRGKDVHLLPEYYVDYSLVASGLLGRAMPATRFVEYLDANAKSQVLKAMARAGRDHGHLMALPIASERGSATMLLDATNGRAISQAAVDPWDAFNADHQRDKNGRNPQKK